MRTQLRTIGLVGAFILALGHAAVPHQHFSLTQAIISTPCDETHSLLSLLGMTLAHDLGEGHLEHFQRGEECAFDFDAALACIALPFLHMIEVPEAPARDVPPVEGPPLLSSLSPFHPETPFRGPPLS